MTREAVAERERLLRELPDLVTPVPFLLPLPDGRHSRRLVHRGAVAVYEALAGRPPSRAVSSDDLARLAPVLDRRRLRGALQYVEGQTDDAGLVLAVLREAVVAGAFALNDAQVTAVRRSAGRVSGVEVFDRLTGRTGEIRAAVVVNATGTWSDHLRSCVDGAPRMRPARGSHLLFARERFPLMSGVVVRSPRDGRPVSVFPWQGATLVGTTDLDHAGDLEVEPHITPDEVAYLLECLQGPFHELQLSAADVVSTWSGLRPLVASGATHSHDELRRHVVWDEHGMLSAAGGKLTTFRALVRDVLAAAAPRLPPRRPTAAAPAASLPGDSRVRPEEEETVTGAPTTWSQLRWAARAEAVRSLDDLMLRRTRLGLLLPHGGAAVLDDVGRICADELGWDAQRWTRERTAYQARIAAAYGVPAGSSTVRAPGGARTSAERAAAEPGP